MACYEIQNCQTNTTSIISYAGPSLTLGDIIKPTPSIDPPNVSADCWTVIGGPIPCDSLPFVTVTSVVIYNSCSPCIATQLPTCYELTDCSGTVVYYTNDNLSSFVGNYVSSPLYPGYCFYVAVSQTCTNPVAFSNPVACTCTCYTLTDCEGIIPPFNTFSNLAAYFGQVIQINENGGCAGPCFFVSVNTGTCGEPRAATVTLNCQPCPPCNDCYVLLDCTTRQPFLTLSNPTANGIDLSTLIGQVIGQVCLGPNNTQCTNGCWEIQQASSCAGSVNAYVYNIFQDCVSCNAVCYKFTNCQTLQEILVTYTVPNITLPNPSTLLGNTLGSLCFKPPTNCLSGCWNVSLNDTADCSGAIDWTAALSYTEFANCTQCQPACYLLTECAPAITPPFIVSNDLSLYVGNVVKICDSQGNCNCYNVELAQTCDGSIVIDNANASFTTCEECNSCDCPPGYTKIDDYCQKITSVPAILNPSIYNSAPGSINDNYGSLGTRFYPNVTSLPYPLTAVTGPDRFVDFANVNVSYTSSVVGIWGGPVGSRLSTVGIWTSVAPNPINEWIGFAQCINIPTTGTYCVGIGGDDCVRVKLDGVIIAEACIGFFDFRYWHVFELNLTAGTHVIVVEGNSGGGPAAFGAEIYQTNIVALQAITTVPALQAITVFSTFPMRSTPTPFQTGQTSGYSCPPGSTLNLCGTPSCTIIETIPFVSCAPTFRVTDCAGIMEPFITNTDLSSYLTGIHKTCITTANYSTTCYLLRDCNRLVDEVITTSNMESYLWTSVSLNEYPGSCFLVLPLPSNTTCVTNPVTLSSNPCVCPNAQQPWPNGCYCVTVEEILIPEVAPDFLGVFQNQLYNCCEDCLRVCYLLTDCQGALDPVVVCNDLELYIGKIIQIEGCGDTCWQVATSNNCNSNTIFAGAITSFETCEDCLPPIPPAPLLELHPRRIKPGYFSPNCKIPLEYIEKVNCTFARQVYDSMLILRYGITVCCDHDLPLWANRKAILDYEMLIDPSLCKSTLCYCPKPCLISVEIVLLPTCVAPVIVNTLIDFVCPAPVVIDAVIEYNPVTADCNCYTITPLEQPIEMLYLDCCCALQRIIIDNLEPINICASTTPAIYPQSGSATVVLNGDCNDLGPCNPPICYCWKVTNTNSPGSPDGEASFDACSTGPSQTSVSAFVSAGSFISNCAFNPPTVSSGLVVENMGPCVNGRCVPPPCQCYEVTSMVSCLYNYTNCDGQPATILTTPGISYICSQTLPFPDAICSNESSVILTSYPCDPLLGTCGPPPPCVCYIVTIQTPGGQGCSIDYTPCGESPRSQIFPDGLNYICSQTPPVQSVGSTCTVTIQSTSLNCGLGECNDFVLPCNCYTFTVQGSNFAFQSIIDCSGNPGEIGGAPGTVGVACVQNFGPPNPNIIISATPGACGSTC
jgi:hypothetical protein